MPRIIGALSFSLCLVQSAWAQTPDVCSRIIDHGLNNIVITNTVQSFADRLYWRFCDEKYENLSDKRKLEFGATIKSIPISLGSAADSESQKFSKFCSDYRTSTDRFSSQAIVTSKMHDKAIDAWQNCIDITNRQIFIDFNVPVNQKYVDIGLKYTGPSGLIKFNGVETTGLKCRFGGGPIDASTTFEINPAEKTIRCERDAVPQDIGGVTSDYYPSAGVTVKTDAGKGSLEFVEMVEGPARGRFDQVETKISSLDFKSGKNLDDLKQILSTQWSNVQTAANLSGSAANAYGPSMCPAGHYAVGVNSWGSPGSTRYCIGCLTGVQLICRPLPR